MLDKSVQDLLKLLINKIEKNVFFYNPKIIQTDRQTDKNVKALKLNCYEKNCQTLGVCTRTR